MQILKPSEQSAKEAAQVLENNGVVVVPSDTAYGLSVNATSSKAVEKIYKIKGRKFGKGISVFLNNREEIDKYAQINNKQKQIIDALLPGPFTIILKSKGNTAPELEAEDNTLGIRVISQPFINKLTSIYKKPITATSANISGRGPHYSTQAFLRTLSEEKKDLIDLVIDGGELRRKATSTVIRVVEDQIEYLRKGELAPQLVKEFKTKGAEETKQTAQKIYTNYFKNKLKNKSAVVIMKGGLGAGKTVFAQGIGELFNKKLVSPTFVLLDEYKINQQEIKNLYHLDLYRIEQEEEIINLSIPDLIKKGNLLLIEWGEKLSIFENLPKENGGFNLIQILEQEGEKDRLIQLYKI